MEKILNFVERGETKKAEERAKKLFPALSEEEVKEIIDTILAAYNRGWNDGYHECMTN